MIWEETIRYIRTLPEYKKLVELAYFEEDLTLNVERFKESEEFIETKELLTHYTQLHSSTKLLDIGSGNGISAIAFALEGVHVDAVEPDPSITIGAGAIKKLKETYQLPKLNVHEGFAEDLKFPAAHFDIVYVRQCMHHAYDLQQFLNECFRVLKKGGVLVTIRDHVIFDEKDKEWFLKNHPLQQYYGGENAFTATEYTSAMKNAGFNVEKELKHFDSVINYYPLSKLEKSEKGKEFSAFVNSIVNKKLGVFTRNALLKKMAVAYVEKKLKHPFDESTIPGRMYSYVALKY